uniref:Cytochrome P450 724B1-like n=1 Tax=Nicotiana tabacum TaxID=4097 RepID=A0A1S4AA91_TOBAC
MVLGARALVLSLDLRTNLLLGCFFSELGEPGALLLFFSSPCIGAGNSTGKFSLPDEGLSVTGKKQGFLQRISNNQSITARKYGKVFKSYLFGSPTIVSCDLEFNTFVLQNEGRLFQSSYPKPVRDILGKHSLILFSFNLMLMNVLNMEPGEPLALQLLEDFLTFMKGFVSIPINLPWTSYAKALKARTRISSTLKQVLKERKKREELGINGLAKEDIFNENFSKGHLSDVEKVSILQDLLLAGYETTSGLLSLLVYFLAHSPRALQYLKEEHRAVRRKKKEGEPLNWEDYKQMKFTSMVINETLRCGNLVKFVHRKAIKDVEFKGYYIPAGWKVLPMLSVVHLDSSLHQNPSEFNPWRWIDPTTSKKVIPFGGGLRLCPGWELAKLEAALFLHHLVINY